MSTGYTDSNSRRVYSEMPLPASRVTQCCLTIAGVLTWPATAASRTSALTQSVCRDASPPNNGLSSRRKLCSVKQCQHHCTPAAHNVSYNIRAGNYEDAATQINNSGQFVHTSVYLSSTGIIQYSAGVKTGQTTAGYKIARLAVSGTTGVHG